jgi:hypothetical protein
MNKEQKDRLLNSYYKADTSLEEEAGLKEQILTTGEPSPENDAFDFYKKESEIPAGLEENIFNAIEAKQQKRKTIKRRIFSIVSAAAVLILIVGVYLDFREKRQREIENRFIVMEQAFARVSETLQPQESQDMLVLWVDNNVEIIIN